MKLDLGAGAISPEGFTPLGHAHGSEIFPLAYADGAAEIIRASHCLEHLPHGKAAEVVKHWAAKLKPGGRLRIAVPDFEKIAEGYLAGGGAMVERYVMGGQTDADDFHKAVFDATKLKNLLAAAGLMLIRPWKSEIDDCAALPISLNLEGTKPHQPQLTVGAVMSLPRVTWTANALCWVEALAPHRISPRCFTGAYWDQCLERSIEQEIAETAPDLVLTIDYDTVFTRRDVGMLIQLMACHPEADAIAPVQAARGMDKSLFTVEGKAVDGAVPVAAEAFRPDMLPIATAHFGLTLIRSAKLAVLPKPWFLHVPDALGGWGEGRRDADVAFWDKWSAAGNSLFLASRVPVGHLNMVVLWPGEDLSPVIQDYQEWRRDGMPTEAWS